MIDKMPEPSQIASAILMVRPAAFGFNAETAESNSFQKADSTITRDEIQELAVQEFDRAVATLRENGITVLVEDDSPTPEKSDAVFPNNWLSTHGNGTVITYPMYSISRRCEVRDEIVDSLRRQFKVRDHWRMEGTAEQGQFLEGTGSMVLDRVNRIAFACRSQRTDEGLLNAFCCKMGFSPILFSAVDLKQTPIYHTNVMMSVMQKQVVICLDSIGDPVERENVINAIESCGHSIIPVSQSQLERFACNALQVERPGKRPVVVISATANNVLIDSQRKALMKESDLLPLSIPTIEHFGGGSVRCMLAEIFLSRN